MTSKYETREDVGKSNEQKSRFFFQDLTAETPKIALNNTMDYYD